MKKIESYKIILMCAKGFTYLKIIIRDKRQILLMKINCSNDNFKKNPSP